MNWLKLKCNLFCASAVIIVLIGVWLTYAPLILHKDLTIETMQNMQQVRPMDVANIVAKSVGRPTFFYAYASWCPTCKPITADIAERIRSRQLSDFNVIAVAWDQEQYDLARYLVMNDYAGLFTPYISKQPLGDALKMFGAATIPGVPYIATFNEMGTLDKQILGGATKEELDFIIARMNGGKLPVSVRPIKVEP